MSDQDMPALETLNFTELLEIIRHQLGVRLKRSVPKERLIQLIYEGGKPLEEELSGTGESRKKLELALAGKWSSVVSQLPCKGATRGKCTVHPCTESRHLDCFIEARGKLL